MTDMRVEALDVHSPVDGQLIGWLPMATDEDVAGSVLTAREAQPGWAATSAAERGAALKAAAQAIRTHATDLANVIRSETGRPFASAREGVLAGVSTLEQYAELGPVHRGRSLLGAHDATDLMVPEPRGVVVALTPWNDPVAVACGLLGAALVTGNAVVHKPSERCPHTGVLLAQLMVDHFSPGVLQSLTGDGTVGAALASSPHVDVVAHVGGTATGRSIAAACAATGAKALLENGGNDPLLVDADVDPVWAAGQAALGAFTNAGQLCTSVERIFVHQAVSDEFLAALCEEARRWNADPQPLVDVRLREHVHAHVTEAVADGAEPLVGGAIPERDGAFYPATVLDRCTPDMRVMREETFGPVAPVRVVPSFERGLAEACVDEHGLAATVLTASMAHAQQAWRALPVGTVKVNAVFGGAPGGAAQPRRKSGTGFGYGPELLDEMTAVKVVHLGQIQPSSQANRAAS
ncbi:succinate-semialdehyde dehydrogenase/glutarate-semialdehyde dehydrogenase [Saccharothrix ecbatanensis]|uniref:Succinate-semialdehyde dehydrogenase/glutarate-semialdehyde dehydrogenase n=1 Tax=Saccharothrix ecbatanensis TaxID=1105145 RepID=A0A7W9LYI2_9PSEU|nr:aldehyde dehydrogenase family protein [Saccharothrix ecbatanensis]MBB5800698.1 succinate-semialdehyde dehydrogenase/glutarate-semialdehyde dehydrogenase [Saccharothrix ecbatanensis]